VEDGVEEQFAEGNRGIVVDVGFAQGGDGLGGAADKFAGQKIEFAQDGEEIAREFAVLEDIGG
jgi:hypothetical protein